MYKPMVGSGSEYLIRFRNRQNNSDPDDRERIDAFEPFNESGDGRYK